MILLEKVNKYFNHHKKNEIHVINNTSLELPDSGLVALLGPSGCGKTTLLNAIGGLDKVKSGNIYVNNQKITRKCSGKIDKIRNLNIGYIFQNYYLIDNKTVFDNVAISLKMIGIKDKDEIKKRVNYVLETLGLYRYRNRLASMLSGGERQRVGIARAIVKDPSIIIADEPTGNLDSANTIEIMNIIKSISKTRLVLLVTHESDIAKFYSDRIIEIEDGTIKNDYENKHNNNLDYRIDNKIYLKDFKHISNLSNEDNNITIYNDKKNDIKLTIVVKNNNIYIKGSKNDKIEVVDNDSNIEFINDHYKQIDKSVYEKYEFNFNEIIDKNQKLRYSSIFNPVSLLVNGFKKIIDYSFIKKLLLLGFLGSGCFITYSVSNIAGLMNVKDEDFIEKNHYYYNVTYPNVLVDNYLKYEKLESVDYILPGSGNINFAVKYPYFYQTKDASSVLSGSLVATDLLLKTDLIYGRLPQSKYEIVVDKMAIENMFEIDITPKQVGITKVEELLNKDVYLKNLDAFKIVGIVDKSDPSIYADRTMFISMLANSVSDDWGYDIEMDEDTNSYQDYTFYNINLKKGRLPKNDYEVIVNINSEYEYPLNKKIDDKINNTKLTVVGYYESDNYNFYVNGNTLKYKIIESARNLTVMPSDESRVIEEFNNQNLNIISSYEASLKSYNESRAGMVKAGIIVSAVILVISFIEIYLMIRASFLSRIKEIGIYRAIGVKKSDIYKMFFGEIFAITTIACIPGIIFVSYCLDSLTTISYFAQNYVVNVGTIILSIILMYGFNLMVGLLPVANVIKQSPAEILARKDLD
ncbi:MAG: ABC transporter ATP-binding protein/permease [Bacilli bacterium]|nr:ABC transporter ATP-binding protein/permease [Bacilli bacterium]